MHVGYARVSTLEQDLSAQREALERLGVENKDIYFCLLYTSDAADDQSTV